jgi:hypothetical protein
MSDTRKMVYKKVPLVESLPSFLLFPGSKVSDAIFYSINDINKQYKKIRDYLQQFTSQLKCENFDEYNNIVNKITLDIMNMFSEELQTRDGLFSVSCVLCKIYDIIIQKIYDSNSKNISEYRNTIQYLNRWSSNFMLFGNFSKDDTEAIQSYITVTVNQIVLLLHYTPCSQLCWED